MGGLWVQPIFILAGLWYFARVCGETDWMFMVGVMDGWGLRPLMSQRLVDAMFCTIYTNKTSTKAERSRN